MKKMKIIVFALVAIFAVSASVIVLTTDDNSSTDGALIKDVKTLESDNYETVGEIYTKVIISEGLLSTNLQSYTISGASWLSITYVDYKTVKLSGKIPFAGTHNVVVKGSALLGLIDKEWKWKITASDDPVSIIEVIDKDNVLLSEKRFLGSIITLPKLTDTSSKVFKGFYSSSSGGNKIAGSGDTYVLSHIEETLYAQWTTIFSSDVNHALVKP